MPTGSPSRSRGRSCAALILVAFALTLGPVGCASGKPREKWWQFWRPKKSLTADASLHSLDKNLLPPPDMIDGKDAHDGISLEPPGGAAGGGLGLPEPDAMRQAGGAIDDLATIHFDFDSSELTPQAQQILDRNAEWIKAHPGSQILIEGHCDERGTTEYNLNLGQRRANTVKAYLVQRGASHQGLHTISYGEERPLDAGHGESSWAQNRRAQFLIYQN